MEWTLTFDASVPVPSVPPFTRGFLLDANGDNLAHTTFIYGRNGDEALIGDWDGDGFDTVGVRRGNVYFLSNDHKGALHVYDFGRVSDTPVVGDGDGNGTDTVSVKRGSVFYVNNSNTDPIAYELTIMGASSDVPAADDFSGDGTDEFGVYR